MGCLGIHLVRTLGAVLPDEPCILVDPVSAEDKDCLETVFHVPAIKLDNDYKRVPNIIRWSY